MRSIDAAMLTTDSVCFESIGDFENSSAPRPRQGTCGRRFTLATNIEAYFCDPQSPWRTFTETRGQLSTDFVAEIGVQTARVG
jgi:hypothetical protein